MKKPDGKATHHIIRAPLAGLMARSPNFIDCIFVQKVKILDRIVIVWILLWAPITL